MKLQSVLEIRRTDKSGLLSVGAIDFLRGNVDKKPSKTQTIPVCWIRCKRLPFVEYDVVLPEDGNYQLEIVGLSPQFHTLDIRI
jgi:hypothetical protein